MSKGKSILELGIVLGKRVQPAVAARQRGVVNKHTGEVFANVTFANADEMSSAIEMANEARKPMAHVPHHERKSILQDLAAELLGNEDVARTIALEAGKCITDAKMEVLRAVDTLTLASEEVARIPGTYSSLENSERAAGLTCLTKRFPVGVVGMVSPFNFPLNLVVHKVAPAIAAGCPFVLKPSDRTPVTALKLGEILSRTTLPEGSFSVLPCDTDVASQLTASDHVHMLSFTGSPAVGWRLKNEAGRKKVLLELGGNAPVLVDRSADIDHVVQRLLPGAFYYAGQACISTQRVFVVDAVYDELRDKLKEAVEGLNKRRGDPMDPATFISPMISTQDVQRLQSWIEKAKAEGGSVLVGGNVSGYNIHDATVLENVPRSSPLMCDEAFGPICMLNRVSSFEEGVKACDDSIFGLQAGVFTNDFNNAFYAFENIETGGVVINDVSTLRSDGQAYGGVKASGLGKEGPAHAILEYTEIRNMIMKDVGKRCT